MKKIIGKVNLIIFSTRLPDKRSLFSRLFIINLRPFFRQVKIPDPLFDADFPHCRIEILVVPLAYVCRKFKQVRAYKKF